jgi:hypothetical protein
MKKVFRVINELVTSDVIETYAVGGAIGATFYVEPFSTTDVDVFIPISLGPYSQLISLEPLYEHLRSKGYHPMGDAVEIEDWHVQFLPTSDELTDEAVQTAREFDVEGELVRVMGPEYLIAIALKTGRGKDFARVKMFKDLDVVNQEFLMELIKRFQLEARWQRYKTLM